jgi:hypothetical protein
LFAAGVAVFVGFFLRFGQNLCQCLALIPNAWQYLQFVGASVDGDGVFEPEGVEGGREL